MGLTTDWSAAIFGVNEAETVADCLLSIQEASEARDIRIYLLLNGTTDNTAEIVRGIILKPHVNLTVISYPIADKAQAINDFIYQIAPSARTYFFIDAYTKVGKASLRAIEAEFQNNPRAFIVTGVPTNGRSSAGTITATVKGGVINGQLYALRPEFMEELKRRGLKLPRNIYRGDPLLGSMACHNFDPRTNPWDNSRIAGLATAPFEISPLSIWRWRDIRRQFNREIRQARGRLENAAIKRVVGSGGYEALPADADDMILQYLATNRVQPRSWKERFFMALALRRISTAAKGRTPGPATVVAQKVQSTPS